MVLGSVGVRLLASLLKMRGGGHKTRDPAVALPVPGMELRHCGQETTPESNELATNLRSLSLLLSNHASFGRQDLV